MAGWQLNRELEVLSAAINFAGRELDWIIPIPVAGRMLKEPEGRLRWLTLPEAVTWIRAAEEQPKAPHLAPLIQLALYTGMRRGELLGLEWERVDLQTAIIYLEGHHTKAGKRRTVPINSVARNAILNQPATPCKQDLAYAEAIARTRASVTIGCIVGTWSRRGSRA